MTLDVTRIGLLRLFTSSVVGDGGSAGALEEAIRRCHRLTASSRSTAWVRTLLHSQFEIFELNTSKNFLNARKEIHRW